MLYTIPDYYHEFTCVAGKCEDTCCAGWQIVADEASLEKYKNETGTFAERLKESVNWEEGTFKQDKDRRCAFLNQSNLCDMYTALGEESLCRTCKLYPRHIEEFEDVREVTLSVSCPEVARILMNKKEPVHFLTYEKEGEEEYEEFDPFLYSMLVDARDAMLGILQDREHSLKIRVGLILGMADLTGNSYFPARKSLNVIRQRVPESLYGNFGKKKSRLCRKDGRWRIRCSGNFMNWNFYVRTGICF